MPGTITPSDTDVLLVVDVQRDFCRGGALEVPDGDAVVPVVNAAAGCFRHAILTQDWHPVDHFAFVSSHPGREALETVALPHGEQTLWPDHCVAGSAGAVLHDKLFVPHAELIVRKGYHPGIDSYSAFFESDRTTPTGLLGYLRERGFRRVFLAGLATDVGVRYSALDARRSGLEVVLIDDACRGMDANGSLAAARREMTEAGVKTIRSAALRR